MESTVISYSPNDFIYNAVNKDIDCSNNKNSDNQKYCKNKEYSEIILNSSSAHSGANERYKNTVNNYNMQLLTSINLGIGIIGIGIFIFYNH